MSLTKCISIFKDIREVINTSFSRQLNINSNSTLHVFCDSSCKAYGAVAYIQTDDSIQFIMAKAKVVPMKPPTLPQLELTAANIAARLASFILNSFLPEISVCKLIMWSDSQIVLHWLKCKKPLKPYVAQRVENISLLTPNATWYHVRSNDNPADILSRGVSAKTFINSSLWFAGPSWLGSYKGHLQNSNQKMEYDLGDDSVNCLSCCSVTENLENSPETPPENTFESLVIFENYSDYGKLCRITMYVFLFISKIRKITPQSKAIQIEKAEKFLVSHVQNLYFRKEIEYLQNRKNSILPIPTLVKQLKLFILDDILHCGGRFTNSNLDFQTKYPTLLPAKCYLSTLIIRHTHNKGFHGGINYTLALLRQKWWIPKARQTIRSILRKCVVCLKLQSLPFPKPPNPPLPHFRIVEQKPFSISGVDYTGAISVRKDDLMVKTYIVLFTCTVTRGIHLELVEDSTSQSFLRAFKRFVARRSCPTLMISDHAKTFISASTTLKSIFESSIVQDELLNHRIDWHFIPARAPWYGGMYERMIGLTKNSIKKMIGRNILEVDELRTLISEVEAIVNDRPISYASTDIDDISPLTPSMLLYGYRLIGFPDTSIDPSILDDPSLFEKSLLTKREHICLNLKKQFWSSWHQNYLLALRERDCNLQKKCPKHPKVGQIVLVHDDSPRLLWKMAKILSLNQSPDGHVRSVSLRMAGGTVTTRPTIKLYNLEVMEEETDSARGIIQATTPIEPSVPPQRASAPRSAALKAKKAIARIMDT